MNSWTMQYKNLLIGDGTAYEIRSITGLTDTPDLRTSDRSRLRRHGLLPGDDFLGGRAVIVELEIFGTDDAAFQLAMDALGLALTPGSPESLLTFKIPGVAGGGDRQLSVRPRKLNLPIEERYLYSQPTANVLFEATDPRLYDSILQAPSVGLTVSVSGLVWNLTWNLDWGGPSVSNTVQAVNSGSFSTPAIIRFNGPVTNPQIENVTAGKSLKLTADGGLVVADGEFVELDTDTRTILFMGTASRYSKLSSDSVWFDLEPGQNDLRFIGSTSGSPTMSVTFRSAWA
jgi:Siphovirus-type tail component, C-terminal domain